MRQSVEDRGSTGSSAVSYMGLSGISAYIYIYIYRYINIYRYIYISVYIDVYISYIPEMEKTRNFDWGNDDKPIFSFVTLHCSFLSLI